MRFLLQEQAYEKPIAAGKLRYESSEGATGAVEEWRLSSVEGEYRFLRVDLDAREAASGSSYIFHLTLNGQNRPERLQFRLWSAALKVRGNVLFEPQGVVVTREVQGRRMSEEIALPNDYAFWFPSSVGLGLLAGRSGEQPALCFTPAFRLKETRVWLTPKTGVSLKLPTKTVRATPLTVAWEDEQRTVWLDEHDAVVQMERAGLTAVSQRYVRYG